jgi:F-type H+-transporting ATPase subunit delta
MLAMLGASRVSLETLREQVTRRTAPGQVLPPLPVPEPEPERPQLQPEHREEGARALRRLTDELFAVVNLLDREHALRGALADGGTPPNDRAAIVDRLLSGQLGDQSLDVVKEAVRLRWSSGLDLADGLEIVAAQVAFTACEAAGTLDRVEDELFRFSRLLAAQVELQSVLDDPGLPVDRKLAVLDDLLAGQVDPTTLMLLQHVVRTLRRRTLEDAIADLVELSAERRGRILADVTVAEPMTADQESRLRSILGRLYGREVEVQVAVDPTVLGGVRVLVGDEIIDGTVTRRLAEARQQITG